MTLYSVTPTGPGDAYYWEDSSTTARSGQHWNDGGDAGGSSSNVTLFVQSSGPGSTYDCTEQMIWPDDLWPWLQDGTGTLAGDCGSGPRAIDPAFWGLNWEHCEVSDPVGPTITLHYMTHVNIPPDWQEDEHDETYERHAQTRLKLATGGRAVPGRQSLIRLTGWATEVPHQRAVPPFGDWYDFASWPAIPPEQIQVGTLGKLDANGELWVVLPDGDPDVTVIANGPDFYIFGILATQYYLKHETFYPALANTNRARTKLGVGEEVHLGFYPAMPTNVTWATSAGGVNTNVQSWKDSAGETVGNPCTFTAPSNACDTAVSATAGGQSLKVPFTVKEPTGVDHAVITSTFTNAFPPGQVAAKMHLNVYVAPTDVSFYRLMCIEVGEDATNTWGGFNSSNAPSHKGGPGQGKGDEWFTIGYDNSWEHTGNNGWDTCQGEWSGAYPVAGQFTWNVPGNGELAQYQFDDQRLAAGFHD